MELKLPQEIKDTPLGQRVSETYSLSDMINQRMTRMSDLLETNGMDGWKDWNERANEIRQVLSLMNEVAKLLIGWGNAQMQWCGEQVKKYKDSYESILRDNSRLRKENSDLKETNVKLATNITNSTSDSDDEVRLNKENSEILREILARVKSTEQWAKQAAERKGNCEKELAYHNFEDRLELYKRVNGDRELFIEELMRNKYTRSTADEYFKVARRTLR